MMSNIDLYSQLIQVNKLTTIRVCAVFVKQKQLFTSVSILQIFILHLDVYLQLDWIRHCIGRELGEPTDATKWVIQRERI